MNIKLKSAINFLTVIIFFLTLGITSVHAQSLGKKVIWTKNQVIEPAVLMNILKNPKAAKPPIYNIGFVNNIPGAINVGAANKPQGLEKLKTEVAKHSKTATLIIYCGCCPFEHCPNVRPAYELLKRLGYSNTKILNLPTSLKADWIDKGYPLAK